MDPSFFPTTPAPSPPSEALDSITDHDARLIFDLVANMRPKADVLARYNMSINDLAAKARNPMWAAAYCETEKVWKSDMNTAQRIRLKAAFLLEDSLIPLFNIIRSDQMPATQKLAAIEQLTKISTVSNVPKEAGAGERHNITINIGGSKPPLIVSVEKDNGGTIIDAV
jgi:hypothetical protein